MPRAHDWQAHGRRQPTLQPWNFHSRINDGREVLHRLNGSIADDTQGVDVGPGGEGRREAPRDFESLKSLLQAEGAALPKRLRQVAAFALDRPDEFALGTAAHLAAVADVQASTLVRFAQTLGYAGFSDLQSVFRNHLRKSFPDYR